MLRNYLQKQYLRALTKNVNSIRLETRFFAAASTGPQSKQETSQSSENMFTSNKGKSGDNPAMERNPSMSQQQMQRDRGVHNMDVEGSSQKNMEYHGTTMSHNLGTDRSEFTDKNLRKAQEAQQQRQQSQQQNIGDTQDVKNPNLSQNKDQKNQGQQQQKEWKQGQNQNQQKQQQSNQNTNLNKNQTIGQSNQKSSGTGGDLGSNMNRQFGTDNKFAGDSQKIKQMTSSPDFGQTLESDSQAQINQMSSDRQSPQKKSQSQSSFEQSYSNQQNKDMKNSDESKTLQWEGYNAPGKYKWTGDKDYSTESRKFGFERDYDDRDSYMQQNALWKYTEEYGSNQKQSKEEDGQSFSKQPLQQSRSSQQSSQGIKEEYHSDRAKDKYSQSFGSQTGTKLFSTNNKKQDKRETHIECGAGGIDYGDQCIMEHQQHGETTGEQKQKILKEANFRNPEQEELGQKQGANQNAGSDHELKAYGGYGQSSAYTSGQGHHTPDPSGQQKNVGKVDKKKFSTYNKTQNVGGGGHAGSHADQSDKGDTSGKIHSDRPQNVTQDSNFTVDSSTRNESKAPGINKTQSSIPTTGYGTKQTQSALDANQNINQNKSDNKQQNKGKNMDQQQTGKHTAGGGQDTQH